MQAQRTRVHGSTLAGAACACARTQGLDEWRARQHLLQVGDQYDALVCTESMLKKETAVSKAYRIFQPGSLGAYLSNIIFESNIGLTLWRENRS
eukprot:1820230-Pleurochrysis_carterae.AAC.5